ncbi:hypothetical protein LJ753_06550 [Arthrobacter sp. zg-Y20]|uniref:hypothetical protein n=1 Tax=unclassified Arthrobacter TaxID=235627 RepID=UPI001D146299|nr:MULTISPECIES: hypothetical protein [unclassified Arthrobacter]MCC3275530.1 hypothetical protein [Arthrobacter sp. zg-Y20]MDK1315687.1 hypothetical protein [Arthrobacter sp. zg.Y20]WIB06097.1 hypothetical protein QNO06_16525 [Arthrobacter sp. zg-Y20]
MKQKLITLVSQRTAWLLLAVCIAFWVVSAAGFLEAPLGTPAALMFLWMYCNLMVALATTLAAAAAVAALVLHRSAKTTARERGRGPAAGQEPVQEPVQEDGEAGTAAPDHSVTSLRNLLARRR